MELTIFDKLAYIFKYITSSFLGIEIFILSVLLFLFTVLNMSEDLIAQSDLAFRYHRLTGMIWDPLVIGMFSVIGFYLFHHK